MKYTLLDLVQTILSSMDSDEVNSIADTVESEQVVKIIRTVYFDIVDRANMPIQMGLFNLDPSLSTTAPTVMYIPDGVGDIDWIKYDCHTFSETNVRFNTIQPLPLADFLNLNLNLTQSDTNVLTTTLTLSGSQIKLMFRNDVAPTYYTSFDDNTLLFDSYDVTVDTTLQSSKTLCYGQLLVPWTESDVFVPSLDDKQFNLLLNEAKSLAFAELKQTQHAKAEASAKRQWVNLQKSKTKIPLVAEMNRTPNYGRGVNMQTYSRSYNDRSK